MLTSLDTFVNIFSDNLILITSLSFITFLGSLIIIPIIIIRLPNDYFQHRKRPEQNQTALVQTIRLCLIVMKNCTGCLFLVSGFIMLFLPGQGLLIMAIGISLIDFPGKYRLQKNLVRRPSVEKSLNWIRKKYKRPPFVLP
jgi:archaellum biogenesis protein FlaJ (TadC family)